MQIIITFILKQFFDKIQKGDKNGRRQKLILFVMQVILNFKAGEFKSNYLVINKISKTNYDFPFERNDSGKYVSSTMIVFL
jgi:hypothetical protein